MKTPIDDVLKLEYFDAVLEHLKWLAVHTDEDVPHDYRTKHLANILRDSFDLIDQIAHEHLIRTDGDTTNPEL